MDSFCLARREAVALHGVGNTKSASSSELTSATATGYCCEASSVGGELGEWGD